MNFLIVQLIRSVNQKMYVQLEEDGNNHLDLFGDLTIN